jgi:hypothetical protein
MDNSGDDALCWGHEGRTVPDSWVREVGAMFLRATFIAAAIGMAAIGSASPGSAVPRCYERPRRSRNTDMGCSNAYYSN